PALGGGALGNPGPDQRAAALLARGRERRRRERSRSAAGAAPRHVRPPRRLPEGIPGAGLRAAGDTGAAQATELSMAGAEAYRHRVTSAAEAVKTIRPGAHVWIHAGCNNPEELVRAMVARADDLRDVEVTHLMTFGCADYALPRHARSFRHRALFTGANVRQAVQEGRADFVPVHLSEIPRLIASGDVPGDVALLHISPPDEHGFCSYAVGVEGTKAGAERARSVIALVNRRMPRSLGDSFIHASRLSAVVEVDRPLLELPGAGSVGGVARAIGRHVAALIEDGATLQLG